jgi:hypothetical protein
VLTITANTATCTDFLINMSLPALVHPNNVNDYTVSSRLPFHMKMYPFFIIFFLRYDNLMSFLPFPCNFSQFLY